MSKYIRILADAVVPVKGIVSHRGTGGKIGAQVVNVATDVIGNNMKAFLESMNSIFQEQPKELGDYSIDEISLNVVVSSEGGIELVGKLSSGVESSITIVLRRDREGRRTT